MQCGENLDALAGERPHLLARHLRDIDEPEPFDEPGDEIRTSEEFGFVAIPYDGGTGTSVPASDSMILAWRTTSAGPAILVPSGATRSTSLPLTPPGVVRSSTKLKTKPAWPGSGEISRTAAP